eukprot:1305579-Amphidinium_carterae.1
MPWRGFSRRPLATQPSRRGWSATAEKEVVAKDEGSEQEQRGRREQRAPTALEVPFPKPMHTLTVPPQLAP